MKKETEAWLDIAAEDFTAARNLCDDGLYRMVCYHAQQAVEKVFKAFLIERGHAAARTHNIIDLMNAVSDIGGRVPISGEDAVFLNSVYRSRYPTDLGLLPQGEPTAADASRAVSIAETVCSEFKDSISFT